MKPHIRIRFLAQIALAIAAGASFLLTLFWRDWMEAMLRFSPDQRDGSLEFLVSGLLFMATIALAASARAEWRRHAVRFAVRHRVSSAVRPEDLMSR